MKTTHRKLNTKTTVRAPKERSLDAVEREVERLKAKLEESRLRITSEVMRREHAERELAALKKPVKK